MEVTIRGKHLDVPEHVEERARKKFGRLDHYLALLRDAVVDVDLAQEKAKEPSRRFVVRAAVNSSGVHLRAEGRAAQAEAALDLAARALAEQARRHKERIYGRSRTREAKEATGEKAQAGAAVESEEGEPDPLRNVTKVKRFIVKPMTTEEALEQMEALGHDFFVFLDAEESQFALLYRRRAGDYGLIIPELL